MSSSDFTTYNVEDSRISHIKDSVNFATISSDAEKMKSCLQNFKIVATNCHLIAA